MRETLSYLNHMRESGVIGDYAVGGAMAAMFYIEPVTTFDLDVFVVLPREPDNILISLAPLYNHLRAEGFKEDKECVIIGGIPVQFIPVFNALVGEALANAVEMDYDGVKVPVFTVEHLAVIALQTGRGKDKARIQSLIESGVLNPGKTNEILSRHGLAEKWKKLTTNQF